MEVDGKQSNLIDVVSGVPQGTVLGLLYFYFILKAIEFYNMADAFLFKKIHHT